MFSATTSTPRCLFLLLCVESEPPVWLWLKGRAPPWCHQLSSTPSASCTPSSGWGSEAGWWVQAAVACLLLRVPEESFRENLTVSFLQAATWVFAHSRTEKAHISSRYIAHRIQLPFYLLCFIFTLLKQSLPVSPMLTINVCCPAYIAYAPTS